MSSISCDVPIAILTAFGGSEAGDGLCAPLFPCLGDGPANASLPGIVLRIPCHRSDSSFELLGNLGVVRHRSAVLHQDSPYGVS